MSRRVLWLVLGTVAMGCSLLPAGRTVVTLPGREGVHELPVVLDDPGGAVANVEAATRDAALDFPWLGAIDDDSVTLAWLGGACDARARLRVVAGPESISIAIGTDEAVGLGCSAVGIPRAITISFVEPLEGRSLVLDGIR